MESGKLKVLFLCTGNTARSQMAEGFLRHLGDDRFEAFSAGFEPGEVNPLAVRAMAEVGVDISGQRSKNLSEFMGRMHFPFVITLCAKAERSCPVVFPGMGRRIHWDLDDPSAATGTETERMEAFRRVRDQIAGRIFLFITDPGSGLDGAGLR